MNSRFLILHEYATRRLEIAARLRERMGNSEPLTAEKIEANQVFIEQCRGLYEEFSQKYQQYYCNKQSKGMAALLKDLKKGALPLLYLSFQFMPALPLNKIFGLPLGSPSFYPNKENRNKKPLVGFSPIQKQVIAAANSRISMEWLTWEYPIIFNCIIGLRLITTSLDTANPLEIEFFIAQEGQQLFNLISIIFFVQASLALLSVMKIGYLDYSENKEKYEYDTQMMQRSRKEDEQLVHTVVQLLYNTLSDQLLNDSLAQASVDARLCRP